MSEFLIIAINGKTILSFRCNTPRTAKLIEDYLSQLGWDVCWFNDPPLIGQLP